MNWNNALGVACITSFFFPVVVIIYNRYYTHRSLTALGIYYILMAIYNMMAQGIIPSTPEFRHFFALTDNYLDAPLMLTALLFFCPNRQKQRVVHILTTSFLAYELIITCIYGFNDMAVTYVMGPGLILILLYALYLFARQVKFSVMHRKNQGRMIMLAALFFAYASYILIYYFFYIQKTPFKADALLIYFISSFFSSSFMSIGLHLMRKRMKELKLLKTTRKELALFFGQ